MTRKGFDRSIMILTLVLVCFGVVMVYSASFYEAQTRLGDSSFYFRKQIQGAVLGFVAMLVLMNIDYHILERVKWPFVFICFILLGLVFIPGIGISSNGAKRWINLGFTTLQPSELVKFAMVLVMASGMAKHPLDAVSFRRGILPYLILAGGFFGIIMLQPNLSMAGSLLILTLVMLYIGGAKLWQLGGITILGGGAAAALVIIEPYRFSRYTAFLDPFEDPLGAGYQLIQSLYAVGSGGLFGRGLGQSRQKFLFLPFGESDFIFGIICEELGWIGAIALIAMFALLIWRGARVALTARDSFGSLLAAGIVAAIGIQVVINIAVVTGSMPPTGLPLPFISAGSSSLIVFMASIGILLNISKSCKSV